MLVFNSILNLIFKVAILLEVDYFDPHIDRPSHIDRRKMEILRFASRDERLRRFNLNREVLRCSLSRPGKFVSMKVFVGFIYAVPRVVFKFCVPRVDFKFCVPRVDFKF